MATAQVRNEDQTRDPTDPTIDEGWTRMQFAIVLRVRNGETISETRYEVLEHIASDFNRGFN